MNNINIDTPVNSTRTHTHYIVVINLSTPHTITVHSHII